jgi:hypothetical protein
VGGVRACGSASRIPVSGIGAAQILSTSRSGRHLNPYHDRYAAIATAVQRIKDASSRWLHEEHGLDCEWQEGYGAFTVSASQLPRTIEYISSQPEHHRRLRFEDEFVALLKKHRIAYDPKFVFG